MSQLGHYIDTEAVFGGGGDNPDVDSNCFRYRGMHLKYFGKLLSII